MCIIVVKPAGTNLPERHVLELCFRNNEDGGGFAYACNGEIILQKGFFKFNEMYERLKTEVKKEHPCIIHFRVATAGKIDKGNCHPFPLVENVALLRTTFLKTRQTVMAHNGIINIHIPEEKQKLSDTMTFIIQILADETIRDGMMNSKPIQKLVHFAIGKSKMAFLDKHGRLLLMGEFEKYNHCFYSNDGYKYEYTHPENYFWEEQGELFCNFCGEANASWNDTVMEYLCAGCGKDMEEEIKKYQAGDGL